MNGWVEDTIQHLLFLFILVQVKERVSAPLQLVSIPNMAGRETKAVLESTTHWEGAGLQAKMTLQTMTHNE